MINKTYLLNKITMGLTVRILFTLATIQCGMNSFAVGFYPTNASGPGLDASKLGGMGMPGQGIPSAEMLESIGPNLSEMHQSTCSGYCTVDYRRSDSASFRLSQAKITGSQFLASAGAPVAGLAPEISSNHSLSGRISKTCGRLVHLSETNFLMVQKAQGNEFARCRLTFTTQECVGTYNSLSDQQKPIQPNVAGSYSTVCAKPNLSKPIKKVVLESQANGIASKDEKTALWSQILISYRQRMNARNRDVASYIKGSAEQQTMWIPKGSGAGSPTDRERLDQIPLPTEPPGDTEK